MADAALTCRPCTQFFTMSPDPHQSHHLACSLELIPNWTFLATQRYMSSGTSPPSAPHYSGLRSKADELTETELDWIERGLELARKYHPVAERRLVEIRSYRLAEKKRMELLAAEGRESRGRVRPTVCAKIRLTNAYTRSLGAHLTRQSGRLAAPRREVGPLVPDGDEARLASDCTFLGLIGRAHKLSLALLD